MVNALTADTFIATLKRFMGCHGEYSTIQSDNSTNFLKANKSLKEAAHIFAAENIMNFLTNEGIRWKFIPARSPTLGGLWGAAVKSFKYHIRRITKNCLFTYEEYYTFYKKIHAT